MTYWTYRALDNSDNVKEGIVHVKFAEPTEEQVPKVVMWLHQQGLRVVSLEEADKKAYEIAIKRKRLLSVHKQPTGTPKRTRKKRDFKDLIFVLTVLSGLLILYLLRHLLAS